MKTRTKTAIVLLAILVPVIWIGQIPFLVVATILAMIASYELITMFSIKNASIGKYRFIMPVVSGFAVVLHYLIHTAQIMNPVWYTIFITGAFVVFLALPILFHKQEAEVMNYLLFTLFYTGISVAYLSSIRFIPSTGLAWFLFMVLVVIVTDTFAYLVGINFGKKKLSPDISPKKSIEGAIGGSVFGALIGTLFAFVLRLDMFPAIPSVFLTILLTFLLTLVLTMFVQIGDLVASKLKRNYNIKDFGNIFPGHGGVLDRFDSMIFTGMVFYILFVLIRLV
jgi:phosphatidate cytidylyltransferase